MSRKGRGRRLAVVWSLFAVLAGVILYAEWADLVALWASRSADGHIHAAGSRDLVTTPIEEVSAVEIVYQGTVHRFERDPEKQWFYHGVHAQQQAAHEHKTDPVAAERIGKALTAFSKARIERRFNLDFAALGSSQAQRSLLGDDETRDYGVTAPSMLVLVYQPGQVEPTARYAVGDVAPDTYSRYIQRLGRPEVVTIANYQITNLQQLIDSFAAPGAKPGAAPAPGAPAQTK